MKKTLWGLAALALSMLMGSCGEQGAEHSILRQVPADADMVATLNPRAVIESAGGSVADGKLTLPDFITAEMSHRKRESFNTFFKLASDASIDLDICAMFAYITRRDVEPVAVARFTDRSALEKVLSDNGFDPVEAPDGLTAYSDRDNTMLLTDDYLYFSGEADAGELAGFVAAARKSDMASTPMGRAISETANDAALAMRFPAEITDEFPVADLFEGSVMCVIANLSADDLTAHIKWLDADGHPFNADELGIFKSAPGTIGRDALRYLGEKEQMVYACNVKGIDWDLLFNDYLLPSMPRSERAAAVMVKSTIEKLDGTIAIGLGLTDGLSSIAALNRGVGIGSQLSATVVVEFADDAAASTLGDLTSLILAAGVPYESTADGIRVDVPGAGLSVYAEARGSYLVISTNPVSRSGGNEAADRSHMADYVGAFALALPSTDAIMRDLKLHCDVEMYGVSTVDPTEGKMVVSIKDGTDRKFLEKFFRLILDIKSFAEND